MRRLFWHTDFRRWSFSVAISVVLLAVALFVNGVFAGVFEGARLYTALCDSFGLVGTAFVCSGVLRLSAKAGTFNFFTYNGREIMGFFIPQRRLEKRMPYYEYAAVKAERRKSWKTLHIFAVGAAHYAAAAVFLALYLGA